MNAYYWEYERKQAAIKALALAKEQEKQKKS